MAIAINPFRPTRWEHHTEGRPLIWFTPTAESLAQEKSTFVRGSRGSGKTTLLKSICWDDLVHNESLTMQRSLSEFRHIGIYLRFPDHISTSMGLVDWAATFPGSPDPELEFYSFFSLAVELACLERAFSACHELRRLERLELAASGELRLIEALFDEFPKLASFAEQRPTTFLAAARLFREIVRRMNAACGRGGLRTFVEALPAREPNEILAFVTGRLSEVTALKTVDGGTQAPGFKFCLDDCEVLSAAQQRAINSLVRLARFPLSWVISSVGSFLESRSTYIPQQQLTDADRRVVSLDDRQPTDFRELCQAVVGLRLLYAIPAHARLDRGTNIDKVFPLDTRLGQQDVNETIRQIVNKSFAPEAEQLRQGAHIVREVMRRVSPKLVHADSDRATWLPFYQTWVLLHWRGAEDNFSSSFEPDALSRLPELATGFAAGRFQAWIRRKQVGALLHLAARLGFRKLPLAGVGMIVSLADGSIRDFLEIMGEVYADHVHGLKGDPTDPRQLERFVTSRTPIASDTQTDGIYAASEAYFEGIANRIDIEPNAVTRLIEGLGIYTSILQSNPNDPSVLGRAERGIFVLRAGAVRLTATRLRSDGLSPNPTGP